MSILFNHTIKGDYMLQKSHYIDIRLKNETYTKSMTDINKIQYFFYLFNTFIFHKIRLHNIVSIKCTLQ